MRLEDVRYENIRINGGLAFPEATETRKWLAVVRPNITRWNRNRTWGRIERIAFKDVALDGGPGWYSILIEGVPDTDSRIKAVSFENMRIQGELLKANSMPLILGPWMPAGGVTFR
jgi:hypothetical protein